MTQLFTVCRPLKSNIPDPPPGWTLSSCDYCDAECWKMDIEPDPLPPNVAAACTSCALKRASHQKEMDNALLRKRERASFEARGEGAAARAKPLRRCSQRVQAPAGAQAYCGEVAMYRFTWPGQDEAYICEEHAKKLRAVAEAMGMPLQLKVVEV